MRHQVLVNGTHRALQDLFRRPPLLRAGDIADLPNTQKQTQRVRQNKETGKYVPNERKNRTKSQQET